MREREHRLAKKRWKAANQKRRKQQRATQVIMADTPESTPPSNSEPVSSSGTETRTEKIKTKYYKYKKRFQRVKQSSVSSVQKSNRYCVLSGAFKDFYTKTKSLKERRLLRKMFNEKTIKQSRMKRKFKNFLSEMMFQGLQLESEKQLLSEKRRCKKDFCSTP
nr:unnamed protein product [Callosobruchus analis]